MSTCKAVSAVLVGAAAGGLAAFLFAVVCSALARSPGTPSPSDGLGLAAVVAGAAYGVAMGYAYWRDAHLPAGRATRSLLAFITEGPWVGRSRHAVHKRRSSPMPEVHLWSLVPHAPGGDDFASVIAIRQFPCVVGRDPGCDYRINNPLISRQHCALCLGDGRVWVEDLQSRNGTRLNGEPVQGARALGDGDELDLAHLPFRVRLVGSPAAAVAPEPANPDRARAAGPRQVLVVEDDDTAAATLALLLKSWGCSVRVAHDGPEAIRAAREEPPDTVFLDIRLPGLNGVEVARRLRRDAGLERARLVAVTGDEGAADVLRSRERFAQLLVKPVSPTDVRQALGQPG